MFRVEVTIYPRAGIIHAKDHKAEICAEEGVFVSRRAVPSLESFNGRRGRRKVISEIQVFILTSAGGA